MTSESIKYYTYVEAAESAAPPPLPLVRGIAILLQSIKNKINAVPGLTMNKVVLTVPIGFGLTQRQTIVDAAKISGLEVMHVIHEPTAAAITYFTANPKDSKTLCVFDFGSSKLDIAIISVSKTGIEVLDCVSDLNLGGSDFDDCVFKYVLETIKNQYPKIAEDKKLNFPQQRHIFKIREKCVSAKVNLSTAPEIK